MNKEKVWLVTGAGRGMGVDIAKAALAAGFKVVATGRNTDTVTKALGEAGNLLVVKLDITKPTDAEAAVKAAIEKFGSIDVLVNNAANFVAGFFEELTQEEIIRINERTEEVQSLFTLYRKLSPRAKKEVEEDILFTLKDSNLKLETLLAVKNEKYVRSIKRKTKRMNTKTV